MSARAIRPVAAGALAAIALAIAGASAHAEKPWETGTTQQQRDEAHRLFTEGNNHYVQRRYPQALESYRAALDVFDHPRIRLGLVRTLVWLGKPAEAHEHIVAALRFGEEPFDADEHREAVDVRASVEGQLGAIVIRCRTDGARITLDGTEVLRCPGEVRRFVVPGRHQIVGSKPGRLTITREVVAEGGRHGSAEDTVTIDPATLTARTLTGRRWAAWKPWSVVAGGAATAGVGGVLLYRADANYERASDVVKAGWMDGNNVMPDECPPPCAADPIEDRADLERTIAWVLFGAGAATITTGLVLVYYNRKQSIAISPEAPPVEVAPVVGPDAIGFVVTGWFP